MSAVQELRSVLRVRPQLELLEVRNLLSAPPASDFMEGNAAVWTTFASDGAATSLTNNSTQVRVGSQSLRFTTASGFDTGIRYTLPTGDSWNLSTHDTLSFWTYGDNNNLSGYQGNQPIVVLSGPGGSFRYEPLTQQMLNRTWTQHSIPLTGDTQWRRTTIGSPSLSHITRLEIHQDTWDYGFMVYYDGLRFSARPPVEDLMKNNAAAWTTFASDGAATSVTNHAPSQSLQFTTASGFDTGIRYTVPNGAAWDLSSVSNVSFWTWGNNHNVYGYQGNQPIVVLSGPGGSFRYEPVSQQMRNSTWIYHDIPLTGSADWRLTRIGNPSLTSITTLAIHQDTWDYGFTVYYSGLRFASSGLHAVPTATILAPTDGATVSGTVVVSVNASSEHGIGRIDLYIDGVLYDSILHDQIWNPSSTYSFFWGAPEVEGSYTFVARVYDRWTGVEGVSSPVTVVVVKPAGIVIEGLIDDALSLTEGGSQRLYVVTLSHEPTADVVLLVAADRQLIASPNRVVFTRTNWNTPRVIVVEAVDDTDVQGDRTVRIQHTLSSVDPRYQGVEAPAIHVQITDNDFAIFPEVFEDYVPPPPPIALVVVLRSVRISRRMKLMVQVVAVESGQVWLMVASPYQKPAFQDIRAKIDDGNGDGVPDTIWLTARRGKRRMLSSLSF